MPLRRAISLLIIPSLFFYGCCSFVPYALMYNGFTNPKDLYVPIIEDSTFDLGKEGFVRTYKISPKYTGVYEIGFKTDEKVIPSGFNGKGGFKSACKIRAEFIYKGKLILDITSAGMLTAMYGDIDHFRSYEMVEFPIPIKGWYDKDIDVRVSVIEIEKGIPLKPLTLYIGYCPRFGADPPGGGCLGI